MTDPGGRADKPMGMSVGDFAFPDLSDALTCCKSQPAAAAGTARPDVRNVSRKALRMSQGINDDTVAEGCRLGTAKGESTNHVNFAVEVPSQDRNCRRWIF